MFISVIVNLSWFSQNKVLDMNRCTFIQHKFANSLTIKNTPQYGHHSKLNFLKLWSLVFRCFIVWNLDFLAVFGHHSKSGPFKDWTCFNHLNTRHLQISDPHCIWTNWTLHQRFYIWNEISKDFWFIVEMFFFPRYFEFFFSVSWTSNFCYCFSPSHSFQGWTIFIF